jgi:hypothetical protein
MPIYDLVEDLRVAPGSKWAIERTAAGQATMRLIFTGSQTEARSETARLNAMAGIPLNIPPASALRRPTGTKAANGDQSYA